MTAKKVPDRFGATELDEFDFDAGRRPRKDSDDTGAVPPRKKGRETKKPAANTGDGWRPVNGR